MTTLARNVLGVVFILIGIASAGLGLKGFLLPSHFIDGGVTGVSMLVAALSGIPLAVLLVVINLPFLVLGYRQVGWNFTLKSTVAIVGLALSLAIVPYPVVTHDKLLASVFGGFFLGAGIGLSIRGGGVLDGTEILALIVSKKIGVTLGDIILVLNVAIFGIASLALGIEPAMYSMLTYLSASKTVDFVIHGIEEYNGIIIVSTQHDPIRKAILNDLGRGVTIFQGKGGMTETEQDILFCVVTRLEIPKVKRLVAEIDETAFVTIHHIRDALGGVVKRTGLH